MSFFAFLGGAVLGFGLGLLTSVFEDLLYQWRTRKPADDGTASHKTEKQK